MMRVPHFLLTLLCAVWLGSCVAPEPGAPFSIEEAQHRGQRPLFLRVAAFERILGSKNQLIGHRLLGDLRGRACQLGVDEVRITVHESAEFLAERPSDSMGLLRFADRTPEAFVVLSATDFPTLTDAEFVLAGVSQDEAGDEVFMVTPFAVKRDGTGGPGMREPTIAAALGCQGTPLDSDGD